MNNDPIEYLYFCDLLNIIREQKIFYKLGCNSKKKFEKYNSLNNLRNDVMHPSRTLARSSSDIKDLIGRIEKMEQIQFYLKSCSKSN